MKISQHGMTKELFKDFLSFNTIFIDWLYFFIVLIVQQCPSMLHHLCCTFIILVKKEENRKENYPTGYKSL